LEQIEKEFSDLKISRYDYDEFSDFRKIRESRFGMTVYKSKWKKRNFVVVHKSVCQKLFRWYHIFDLSDFDPKCLNEEEQKIMKAFMNDNKTEILDSINREHKIYTSKVIETQMISNALSMQSGG
ncbi:17229_t:CDS:2, partial [Dentiscutata erythropus]